MPSTSAEHSRRAVYAAASRVFSDHASLKLVLSFWESRFADAAVFHVADFATKLNEYVGLNPEQRRTLMVSIFSALSKSEHELSPVPETLRSGYQSPPEEQITEPVNAPEPITQSVTRNPANVVFAAVISGLVEYATARQANTRGEVVQGLPGALRAVNASDRSIQKFSQWSEAGFEIESVPVLENPKDMSNALNAMYVAVCEAAGPVAADRALAKAVAEAGALPEGESFAPESLL